MIIIASHAIERRRKVTNRKGYYSSILCAKLDGRLYKKLLSSRKRGYRYLLLNHIRAFMFERKFNTFSLTSCARDSNKKNEDKNDKNIEH